MFSFLNPFAKYLKIGVAVAFLVLFAHDRWLDRALTSVKAQFKALTEQSAHVTLTLGEESGNPKLNWKDVPEQIRALSDARKQWREASERQTQRVGELAAETERLKRLSEDLRQQAIRAIAKRDSALQKLDQMALTPGERADLAAQLLAAEQALDLVYEEGL